MKVILIPVEGEPSVVEVSADNQLRELQGLVGGYIEAVRLRNHLSTILLANEEGLLMNLLGNHVATAVAGRMLVGDCVLVGSKGADFVDVGDEWIRELVDPTE